MISRENDARINLEQLKCDAQKCLEGNISFVYLKKIHTKQMYSKLYISYDARTAIEGIFTNTTFGWYIKYILGKRSKIKIATDNINNFIRKMKRYCFGAMVDDMFYSSGHYDKMSTVSVIKTKFSKKRNSEIDKVFEKRFKYFNIAVIASVVSAICGIISAFCDVIK